MVKNEKNDDYKEIQLFFRQNQFICLQGQPEIALSNYLNHRPVMLRGHMKTLLKDIQDEAKELYFTSLFKADAKQEALMQATLSRCETELYKLEEPY